MQSRELTFQFQQQTRKRISISGSFGEVIRINLHNFIEVRQQCLGLKHVSILRQAYIHPFLIIIFIIVSLIIIVLSLLQGGKSEGASGAITGGGLNVFAKTKERGSEKVITWLTFGFAIVFLFLALIISVVSSTSASEAASSVSSSL